MAIPGKSRDMTATETATAPGRRLEWQVAEVDEIVIETPRVKSLFLHVTGWQGYLPGQHVDIRLTAEDGYQAQRSYSIASAPEDELLTLTVERVMGGEVSPYLVDELHAGDRFQLRGPVGGYFVWTVATGGPLYLIAGGSGIAPLMAMLRHRERHKVPVPTGLLYSSRSLEDVIYREELDAMAQHDRNLHIAYTLTRKQPEGWVGRRGRIDKAMLTEAPFPLASKPNIFVCGPTPFVEHVSNLLVELGHDALAIKTERFGPTGG
jgi:ferredoxin-NADP reductase